jgi:hypothetical protein
MGKQQFCDAPIDCWERNRDALRSALGWICEAGIFDDLRFHGNTKWRPAHLVALTLSWVWSRQSSLADAFTEAHQWSTQLFG